MYLVLVNRTTTPKKETEYPVPEFVGFKRQSNECHFTVAVQSLSYIPEFYSGLQHLDSEYARIFLRLIYSKDKDITEIVNYLSSLKLNNFYQKGFSAKVFQFADYFNDFSLLIKAFKLQHDHWISKLFSVDSIQIIFKEGVEIESKVNKNYTYHCNSKEGFFTDFRIDIIEEKNRTILDILSPASKYLMVQLRKTTKNVPLVFTCENRNWHLFASVNHTGNHFYSVIKDLKRGTWNYINDETVREMKDASKDQKFLQVSDNPAYLIYFKSDYFSYEYNVEGQERFDDNMNQFHEIEKLFSQLPILSSIAGHVLQKEWFEENEKHGIEEVFKLIYSSEHFVNNKDFSVSFSMKFDLILKSLWSHKNPEKLKYLALPFLIADREKKEESFILKMDEDFEESFFFNLEKQDPGQFIYVDYDQSRRKRTLSAPPLTLALKQNKRYDLIAAFLSEKDEIRSAVFIKDLGYWLVNNSRSSHYHVLENPEVFLHNITFTEKIIGLIYSLCSEPAKYIISGDVGKKLGRFASFEQIKELHIPKPLMHCVVLLTSIPGFNEVSMFSESAVVKFLSLMKSDDISYLYLASMIITSNTEKDVELDIPLTMKKMFDLMEEQEDTKLINHFLSKKFTINYKPGDKPNLEIKVVQRVYGEIFEDASLNRGGVSPDGTITLEISTPLSDFFFFKGSNPGDINKNSRIFRMYSKTEKQSDDESYKTYCGLTEKVRELRYEFSDGENTESKIRFSDDIQMFALYKISSVTSSYSSEEPDTSYKYIEAFYRSLSNVDYSDVLQNDVDKFQKMRSTEIFEMLFSSTIKEEKFFALQFLSIYSDKPIFTHKLIIEHKVFEVENDKYIPCDDYLKSKELSIGKYLFFLLVGNDHIKFPEIKDVCFLSKDSQPLPSFSIEKDGFTRQYILVSVCKTNKSAKSYHSFSFNELRMLYLTENSEYCEIIDIYDNRDHLNIFFVYGLSSVSKIK